MGIQKLSMLCIAHLLASAGMDHAVCIWNVWSRNQKKACLLNFHNAAVKDVKWSQQGHFLLSCGYDCTSRLIDVEKGLETQVFRQDQIVGVIKLHPDDSNLFLSEGSKGQIKLCDARTGKVVHDYNQNLGLILDVEFTMNGKQFISSSDVSQSNASENAIIVWDVSREVPLSNQPYSTIAEASTHDSRATSRIDPVGNTVINLMKGIQTQLLVITVEKPQRENNESHNT
ncbi:WD repeat-containing protein 25 [Glycine max]|nr:WD repeat-containing protein 25 [Glycine max]